MTFYSSPWWKIQDARLKPDWFVLLFSDGEYLVGKPTTAYMLTMTKMPLSCFHTRERLMDLACIKVPHALHPL